MEKIQIKCTSCGQKFAVSESYENRMVECGACDHRFKVDDTSIIRNKKRYYPGERAAVNSDSYAKVESDSIPAQPTTGNLGFQPAQYDNFPNPELAAPLSTKRSLMVMTGVILIGIFILVYLLGSGQGGLLQNVDDQKRIILAGFIAVLGAGLIVVGMRRKVRALLVAIILGGALCALPFYIKAEKTPELVDGADLDQVDTDTTETPETKDSEQKQLEDYKRAIGYRKVVSLRKNAPNPENVKAIVVRDIGSHTDTICNYFKYEFGLDMAPSPYNSSYKLAKRKISLIIFKAEISNDDLLEMTKKFATPSDMEKTYDELDVIDVTVNEALLRNADTNVITDENNQRFFSANYLELSNISRDRQLSAIRRLAKVQTSLGRRADIATKLASMISTRDKEKSNDAIAALKLWTKKEYDLDGKVKAYAEALVDQGNLALPVMEYLVEKQVPGISDILATQWLDSNGHLVWDDLIQKAGAQGEQALIKALPKANSAHLKAGSTALMRIGTKRSLPVLTAALKRASKEDAKYLKATIDEIKSRR